MTAITPSPALRAAPTTSAGIAGAGQRVGVVYGVDRRDALVSTVVDIGDKTLMVCIWSQGGAHGIDAVTGLTINDENPPAGTVVRHYLGVADQPVDPAIQAHLGVADNLVTTVNGHTIALAYSVLEIPDTVGFPRVSATIRGLKVNDPRTSIIAWSDCPALCLADLIESPVYGMGRPALNVAEAANFNDELVDGGRRRQLGGLSIGYDGEPARERVDKLREYAGCFVVNEGAARKLVPRRAETPVATITNDELSGEPTLSRGAAGSEMPTGVRVNFTNTDSIPWRQNSVLAVLPGVSSGDIELVETVIDMPGIHSGAVAAREANERLNHIKHGGLELNLPLFAEQLQRQVGDVVRVEIPEVSGDFRIMPFESGEDPGLFTVNLAQENPQIYTDDSNYVELLPAPPVPRQDSVGPPSIGGVTSGNGVYVEGGDGTIHNRIRVDLSVPADPKNFDHYEIRFRPAASAQPWQTGQVTGYTAWLYPVQDGVEYEFEVRTAGRINGVYSPWVAGRETVRPKNVPPPPCTNLDATVNAAGQRRVGWQYGARPADFAGFEVQYDAGAGYIDLITGHAGQRGLTQRQIVETGDMPAGSVTLRVRAVDTSGAASDWIYTTANFELGPDGKWQDVDQRILNEKNRNDGQDGTLGNHDGRITNEHNRNNGQDGTLTSHDGRISTESNRNNSQDGTLNSHDGRINTEASRNDGQDGSLVNHDGRINTEAGRNDSQDGTLNNHDSRINAADSTANTANSNASTALTTAQAAQWEAENGDIVAGRIKTGRINFAGGGFLDLDSGSKVLETASGDVAIYQSGFTRVWYLTSNEINCQSIRASRGADLEGPINLLNTPQVPSIYGPMVDLRTFVEQVMAANGYN